MTDRSREQNRSAVDLSAVIPWVNDAGEEIPAYGVVQLRTNFDTKSHASKPDSTEGLFFVNGPVPVAATKHGESLVWSRPRVVLLEASAAVGDLVGPVEDSWEMTSGGSGFRVLRQATEGRGVVVQVGGGDGSSHEIFFQIESVVCDEFGAKTLYVTALWYDGGCTGAIPGEDEYGQIEVIDPCNELDFYTEQWLSTGSVTGWAKRMYPRGAEYCEPQWLVRSICGVPECS